METKETKYRWDIFGIAKTVALVIFVIFVFTKWGDLMNIFKPTPPQPPQIIQIADNALLIKLVASDQKVKELESELKDKNSLILKYAKENKEKIDEIGIIQGKLNQTVKLNQASAHVYLKGDVNDHHFIKIYKKASDGTEFPIAWAMFHPNQPDPDKLWKTGTYPVEFNVDIIETESKDGTYNRYAELNVENNQMKETKGNRYPVKVTRIDWAKRELDTKSWSLWNPRLGLSGIFTNDFFAPALDLSIASYGKTDVDMDWRFLTLGIGAANVDGKNEVAFAFTPVQWNFGTAVPLINNAFIGPTAGWHDGKTSFGVTFSIPF